MVRVASALALESPALYCSMALSSSRSARSAWSRSSRTLAARACMVDTTGLSRTNFIRAQSPKKQTAPQNSSLATGRIGLFGAFSATSSAANSRVDSTTGVSLRSGGRSSVVGRSAVGAPARGQRAAPTRRSDELEEDEDDEADEGEGLGEGDAEEHGGAHHAGGLWLAGHRLDGLTDQVADADAGADGAEAVGEPSADGGVVVLLVGGRSGGLGKDLCGRHDFL